MEKTDTDYKQGLIEKFRLNFSNRFTVTQLYLMQLCLSIVQ